METQDRWGNTALNDAIRGNNAEIIQLLVEYGFRSQNAAPAPVPLTSTPLTAASSSLTVPEHTPIASTSGTLQTDPSKFPADDSHQQSPVSSPTVQPSVHADADQEPIPEPHAPQETASHSHTPVGRTPESRSNSTGRWKNVTSL